MKPDIHPKYKPLKIIIGSDTFNTCSTYYGDELLMDVDFRNHVAWNHDKSASNVNESNQNVQKFNQKFSGLGF
jgi:ribosomal protein L31